MFGVRELSFLYLEKRSIVSGHFMWILYLRRNYLLRKFHYWSLVLSVISVEYYVLFVMLYLLFLLNIFCYLSDEAVVKS